MKLGKFILKALEVGSIGFGGGNALIPVMERTFLSDSTKAERKAFDRDIIVANLTPGALPLEILSSIGRRECGTVGMLSGAAGFALPGTILVVLLMIVFAGNQQEVINYIKIASVGVSAYIVCLLIDYVVKVFKRASVNRARLIKTILMVALVCVCVCGGNVAKILGIESAPVLGVSTIVILAAAFFCVFYVQTFQDRKRIVVAAVLCIIFFLGHGKAGVLAGTPVLRITEILMVLLSIYGAVRSVREQPQLKRINGKAMIRDVLYPLTFLVAIAIPAFIIEPGLAGSLFAFMTRGSLSSLMSFGGGDAYLAIADGLFVNTGMISSEEFYSQVVTVVNVTPGSILCKTLCAVGFSIGHDAGGSVLAGVLFSAVGFGCSVSMSCIAFNAVYHLYDSLIELQMFMALSRWIRPIVGGLLINVALSLISQDIALNNYVPVDRASVLLFVFPLVAINYLLRKKVPDVILLAADIVVSLLWVHFVVL